MLELIKAVQGVLTVQLLLPAITLFFLLALMFFVLLKAQARPDFDLTRMLRNDHGKESALQLTILGSFAVSTWVIMSETLNARLTSDQWWGYLFTWSGALVFVKAAERWNGQLPFVKGPSYPPQEPAPPAYNLPERTHYDDDIDSPSVTRGDRDPGAPQHRSSAGHDRVERGD